MFYNQFYDEHDGWFCDEHIWEQDNSFCISEYQVSETVVFRPSDYTTAFLKAIYKGKGWDVVNDPSVGPDIVEELIETHDRIVCLGHGSPVGLFGGFGMIINSSLVSLLKKKELVCIWCHADLFMKAHDLKGFYSGMLISETGEAWMCGIDDTDKQAIKFSNELFASVLGKYIDSENILERVKSEYVNADDPVVSFNRARLYSR